MEASTQLRTQLRMWPRRPRLVTSLPPVQWGDFSPARGGNGHTGLGLAGALSLPPAPRPPRAACCPPGPLAAGFLRVWPAGLTSTRF